jgi:hypothetical protein
MGRYLDLVRDPGAAAKSELRGYDINDINDQRADDRNDQKGLRSYLSFLSHSGTYSADDRLSVPTES